MNFQKFVFGFAHFAVLILDMLGIVTVLLGAIKCAVLIIKNRLNFLTKEPLLIFANALAFAMEFKLGSEIIKTMTVKSLDEILTLASVVAIKIVLSLVIHMEIKNAQEYGEKLHIEPIRSFAGGFGKLKRNAKASDNTEKPQQK